MYRYQNSHKAHDRVPSYYAENRLYPGSYVRNEYPARTSRRVHDGLVIGQNYGLDTTSDDVNSSPYSSPYYINGRYNSTNLTTQRGNSASVQGITRLNSIYDSPDDTTFDDHRTIIEMWQGKQIKFELPYSGKVIGNKIAIKNTDGCTGILSIYISAKDGGTPIYETAVDLCEISQDKFDIKTVYSILPVKANANPRGKLYVRMEIWNEILMDRTNNPFNSHKKIEIIATGAGNHYSSEIELGEKNVPVEDKYDYKRLPNRPQIGLIYNEWESIPVSRTESSANGASVSLNGYRYDIFCIKNAVECKMLIYDKAMNKIIEGNNIKVDGRAEFVNIIQVKDMVYYVDGYSPLQKFTIGTWTSSAFPISQSKDDANPVLAPSIITMHNNRVYLSGFRYDPNLLQFTEVTGDGPQFNSFLYRAYVPDESPLVTSTNAVTAILEYESDTLMIVGKTFYSLYQTDASGGTIETAMPQQVSTYTDSGGVQSAGDICSYNGVIYSFDQDEGIRRFNGGLWHKIPASVDSHIERVDMSKPRKIWGYANKLYFNYTDKLDGKYKCLIWDMDMNYQQFPWFQDTDIPFCDVRYDDDYDIVGIHPDYPCIMQLYAEDTWRRFDTPITFERHTKWLSLPGNMSDMILRRVQTKVIANANRWWWIGISADKHTLKQERNVTTTYRIPCWDTLSQINQVEDAFSELDEYEEKSTSLLSINNIRNQAISVQVKVKCKTFRAQANLISIGLESAPRQYI